MLIAIGVLFGGILTVVGRLIDYRIDTRMKVIVLEAVTEVLDNGITARLNNTDKKLDRLINTLIWDGRKERRLNGE